MKYDLKQFGWVTNKDGIDYYRSIENPNIEIEVTEGKMKKTDKKIQTIIGDVRPKKERK